MNLSGRETNEKRKYGKKGYHNMSEEKKKRLKKLSKMIIGRVKSLNLINKIVF